MGSHKRLIEEYIDEQFPRCSSSVYTELFMMICDAEHPQAKAFLAWVNRDDSPPMFKDRKHRCTEAEYAAELKEKPLSVLEHIMNDALSAMFSMPTGVNTAYYAAEARLCLNEWNSRG